MEYGFWGFDWLLEKVTSLIFRWNDNLVVRLVSNVIWLLYYAGIDWLVYWYCAGAVCVRSDSKFCNSHPSGSISPKRELQRLTLGFGFVFLV